jgi:hypothetical protein
MHMILAYHSPDSPNFKCVTGLPDQLSDSLRDFSSQNLVTVFRDPNKMTLNLKDGMAAISIFHRTPPCPLLSQLKLIG